MYAVERKSGRWELRQAVATADGPRSRTLASFRELDEEAIARAIERGPAGLDASAVRDVAVRAGAPVADDGARRAATELIGELGRGGELDPGQRRVLLGLLDQGPNGLSAAEREAAAWADASPRRRGDALRDLLSLADRIPARAAARASLEFPPLRTRRG